MIRFIPLVAIAFAVCCCSPAKTSRIGPPVDPRALDCDIELLEPGQKPDRPYRDVGLVTLENCQDYTVPPCLGWLEKAACALGGSVAYVDEEQKPAANIVAPMTYRVLVAAYLSDLATPIGDDLLTGGGGPDCDTSSEEAAGRPDAEPPDKCVE